MIQPVDTILALVLLSVLISFGSSRLPMLIRVLAFQGVKNIADEPAKDLLSFTTTKFSFPSNRPKIAAQASET